MRNIYKIIFILISFGLQAQLQTAHWYFGQNAGLDFSSGSPVAVTDGQINTVEGSTTFSDNDGNLIFYTDGQTVYNRNHSIMVGGTGLMGHESSTQSAIIIPKPESPNIYYIFTIWNVNGVRYNVVDMSLDGGNGAVIEKNTLLMSLTGLGGSEKLTAATIAGCSGYWVLTHFVDSFYAFAVTSSGINLTPVVSTVGVQSYYPIQGAGHIKLSPNGKKLGVAHRDFYNDIGVLGLYDFDNASGTVSNEQLIYTPNQTNKRRYYGVEFSPDNNVLYATCEIDTSDGTTNVLEQYDLNNSSIIDSRYIVDSWDGVVSGALQLGLDNKIYHARWSDYLGIINQPNEVYNNINGTNPDYNENGIFLDGQTSTHGLPPFITSLFYAGIMIDGIENIGEYCYGELSFSYCHNGGEMDNILWDFGDGTTSNLENPIHTYDPGTYTIILELTIGGIAYTTEEQITIHPLPTAQNAELEKCISEGQEVEFDLTESFFQIDPSGNNFTITFHEFEADAETGDDDLPTTYTISTTTTIWIRIENEFGCHVVRELELIVNEIPTFTIDNAPIEICEGSSAELEITTDATNTVRWYADETDTTPIYTGNPFMTPNLTATTSYWVEVVSGEGCPSQRQEVTIVVSDEITPLFTQIPPICFEEIFVLPGEDLNEITGTWTPAVDNTQTTIYTFHPDAGQCAAENVTMTVEIVPIPELILPTAPEICLGETATITIATTGEDVNWYVNETDLTPIFIGLTFSEELTATTTYWLEAVTENCRSERIPFTVTVNPLPTIEAGISNPVCEGNPAELSVITNGQTVNWYDSETASTPIFTGNPFTTPNLNQTTIYWVEAISIENCISERIVVTATVLDEITPIFNIEPQYCLNSPEITLPTISENGLTGIWSPTIINTNNLGTQNYTFTPDLECGQPITIPITIVDVIVPEFENLTTTFCLNSLVNPLPNQSDNGIEGTWLPSEINTNIQGITVYTFTPDDNQCSEEYLHTVTVYPNPDMDLEEELLICEGDSFTYSAPDGFDSYEWKNELDQIISSTQEVIFTQEGIYTLTVEINGIPCNLSRDIEVRFSTPPTITEIKTTENSITVYATGGNPLEYSMNEVFWQSSPTFTNLQPGIFNVFVRDAKGCSTTAKQAGIMGVPNFISPNGDGYNDSWEIRALEIYPNTRLQIFDRYGKIFVDKILNTDFKWDGKYNSQPLPSGSYWYILILETGEKVSGHITIRN